MSVNSVHKKVIVSLIILVASMGFTVAALYAARVPEKPATADVTTPAVVDEKKADKMPAAHVYSLPTRIVIPKLKVDAAILPMGQTKSGAMESPKTNKDAGWYSLGARPGNVGTSVIAGHLGLRKDAVFGNLDQLVVGDTFSIVDDQGTSASFVVREVKSYARESDSTEVFNSTEGSHLNLITCNGDWETKQATYEERLVVFSDKV